MNINHLLFSQISTLGQTGMPDITLDDYFTLQTYHAHRSLLTAKKALLSSHFKEDVSSNETRLKQQLDYFILLNRACELLETLREAGMGESYKA